ncbi:MAG: mechanosensitive ion channel [Ruminococcaceae bacterium]|nr:mechanosensitive ion channel [Oscillospiraceae bacterium]
MKKVFIVDWDAIVDSVVDAITSFGLRLLTAMIVFFVAHKFIKKFRKWIRTSERFDKFDEGVRSFLTSFCGIVLYIILAITITIMLGIPSTSLITALASCGVAIGLALQGSLSNFAGGIMILIFKPFKVGDYICTEETSGTVSEITVVYTILHTPDNKVITVPNGTLTNSVIENYSAVENRRIDITFNVSYDSDIDKVKSVIMNVISERSQVLPEPQPFARLSDCGENSLVYTIRVWCKTEDYWNLRFDIIEEMKRAFDRNGISIPFPQLDVHIKDDKAAK